MFKILPLNKSENSKNQEAGGKNETENSSLQQPQGFLAFQMKKISFQGLLSPLMLYSVKLLEIFPQIVFTAQTMYYVMAQ